MAKAQKTHIQHYPRIQDEDSVYYGFFDDTKVSQHTRKPSKNELKNIIKRAIKSANEKSSRSILNIENNLTEGDINKIYVSEGKELFKYFIKYYGDPAATAYDCINQHYTKIGKEQFRNRTIQKERMNSGWRYQFIAKDTAILSKRFHSVSDLGTSEADFNAEIAELGTSRNINIYVSVKNRTNTLGGQDWPKAISAMENMAQKDKNRSGPYLCVFGIAMDKGIRHIKIDSKTKKPHSINTEIWLSDFFWPFFSNCKYDEIIMAVLEVLTEEGGVSSLDIEIPQLLLESFGQECKKINLLDEKGNFNDPKKLVELFCGKLEKNNK